MSHLQARAQSLSLHTVGDLPPVRCDETRTRQITRALLYDTCRHTPHGEQIDVAVSHAIDKEFLQIVISASAGLGHPTPPTPHARSTAPTTVNEGSIEMHIARSLVQLHGGCLELQRASGGRRILRVALPIAGRAPQT